MHKFNPENIGRLIGEERERELPPETFLINHGLKEGMVFTDIGCGPGFFSIPAAKIVGNKGTVFAVDLQEEMLEEIKKRTASQNIFFLKSEENTIPIENKKTDLLLLAFVLHETIDKVTFLKELRRIIKEGGKALIIDWEKKEEERGPPFQDRLERSEAVKLIEETGFTIEKISSLCNGSHYCVTAKIS